jgi:WD40 repeat protein/serine/threonine protein kinase
VDPEKLQPGPLTGRTLGDFVVEGKLGEGGFGDVYIAVQPVLAREAVIKTLRWETGSAAETVQRFLREARVASSLDHPFSAHIYAFGAETDGTLWIAMERVKGSTLADLIETSGPLPLSRLVPLMERICEVVHTAHEHGIVHRDIKPQNVMIVSRAGRLLPKLLDFGVAKALGGDVIEEAPAGRARSPTAPEIYATGTMGAVLSRAGIDASRANLRTGRALLGSPRYMAPEQWFDPRSIDRRADIYALGAVCYEALTGKPAFDGDNVRAIAAAHARSPVPALPPEMPPGLDAVLAKAMAKAARDRYATTLELAVALRAASGEPADDVQLPALDETLRDAVLATAPQPIADAVAAYEAAATTERAARAITGVAHAIVRYVGAVAIAARASTGGLPHTPALAALVARWRAGGLDAAGWIELARLACEDFLSRADLFPIPELPLLFAPDRTRPVALADLAALDAPAADGATRELAAQVATVERVLGELRFLSDYPLVADLDGVARTWMGARRRRRPAARLAPHATIEPAEPVILDGQGTPIIRLFPLVQIAAPSPGADDELFVLERGHRLGAVLVAQPVGFERRDDRAWSFFGALATAADAGSGEVAERSPYRGLASFSTEDADWYFGREREAEAFANRLREHAFIAVVGPSGVGKSSFVKAGVLPRLADPLAIVFRPGDRPIAALAAALSGPLGRAIEPAALAAPSSLRDLATELAAAIGRSIAIVVDQFEELVTLCRDPDERARLGALLVAAGESTDLPVRVVITLRDDFLVRAEEVPSLRHRLGRSLQLLTTPAAADLVRILVEPARKAGYAFDDPELPARIVEDVEARPGALALLSFTAMRLWELRDERYRQLKHASYEAMGGVGGALAQHAEETLAALPAADAPLVREAFRHLVTADGTRAVLSKTELGQVLGGGERADSVIQQLIGARLLASSEGLDGEDRVEVVHEALLSAWPRLVEWRREDAETARLRDQLRAGARQWDERGRGKGLLWRGDELVELTLWRRRYPGKLTEREEEFVAASLADAARGRRIRRTVIAGSVAVLLAASAILLVLYRTSQTHRRAAESARVEASAKALEAQQRVVELLFEQGRAAAIEGKPLQALVYLDAAHARGARGAALEYLVGGAAQSLALQRRSFHVPDSVVAAVAFTGDGGLVASTLAPDRTIRVFDLATGAERGRVDKLVARRLQVRGDELVAGGLDRLVAWTMRSDPPRIDVVGDTKARSTNAYAVLSADGSRLLWFAEELPAQLHDGRDGRLLRRLAFDSPTAAAMSPSGLTALSDLHGNIALFSRDGVEQRRVAAHAEVWHLALAPDDSVLVAATDANQPAVLVWDRAGRLVATMTGHRSRVTTLDISPDSQRLLTASEDGSAKLWRLDDGRLVTSFDGHLGPLVSARFDPRGRYVATGSADGTAKLWLLDGTAVTTYHGHTDALRSIAFSADGDELATASVDATARVWSVHPDGLEAEVSALPGGYGSITGFADGSAFAIGPGEPPVMVSATGEVTPLAKPDPMPEVPLIYIPFVQVRRTASLSPGGARIAAPVATQVAVWERATGALAGVCRGHERQISAVRFTRDGAHVLSGDETGVVRSCDLTTFESTEVAKLHERAVLGVDADPTGAGFATGGFDRRVVIARADGTVERELTGHTNVVTSTRFSADGKRLVSSSVDTTVRVWDRATGAAVAILQAPAQLTSAVMNDEIVAAAAVDGLIYVWETEHWRLVRVLGARGTALVNWVELVGGDLAASDTTGRLRRWRFSRAHDLAALHEYVACRIPYELVDNQVQLRRLEPSDACAAIDESALLSAARP